MIVASSLRRCWRGWRLDLDGVSRGRSRRVDGWIWTSLASASRSFHTFFRGKQGRRNNAPRLFGVHHAKGGVALLRRPIFEPLFTTHPSQVGSATPWTLLAAMLRGPLSHPICRQTIAFCGVFERDSRCIGFAILSSLRPFQQMCHLIPLLILATNCT